MSTEAENQSAQALINQTLARFGLPSSLGETLFQQYRDGVPVEQIMLNMRQTPEYKARFPVMEELSRRGIAMTEDQVISYERNLGEILAQAGIPQGFYDSPEERQRFLTANVSLAEVADRAKLAQQTVFASPPEVRQALEDYYGVGVGELTAFFLDEKRALPLIEKKARAAQFGGDARRVGFAAITREQAERLVDLGVDRGDATAGFAELARSRELFTGLSGTAEQREQDQGAIGTDAQLGAAFGGVVADAERIERRRAGRVARFREGGGFASSREGIEGLGRAR